MTWLIFEHDSKFHSSIDIAIFSIPKTRGGQFDVGELDQDSKATYVVTAQCSSAQIAIALVMETLTKSALSGLI